MSEEKGCFSGRKVRKGKKGEENGEKWWKFK